MKYILVIVMVFSFSFSQEVVNEAEVVQLKDTSGLSEEAVRKIAEKIDKEDKQVSLKEIYEMTDANGTVNVQKLQALWEDLSPKTNGFDWIKTKKGEWFKGEIKAMYDEKIEFDSEEMGIHEFDLDDIAMIKTHNVIDVNIEKLASVSGIIRLDGEKIKIIQGNTDYEFAREQVVSFAPNGELERNLWSGKLTLSIDAREGNKNQFDYTAMANLKRRTNSSSLQLDYLGRISSTENQETANDHRLTETYDVYITKAFFWTPLFSEYYTDQFQNIDTQLTGSVGLGYTLIDRSKLTWKLSGGPGIVYTEYSTVERGEDARSSSPSFEARTNLEYEVTKTSDLIFDYRLTLTEKNAGQYKHHMIFTLENELTSWLDLDLSFIWDHLQKPTAESNGNIPFKDDYQMLIGLGVEF